jgi:hypothetical protein
MTNVQLLLSMGVPSLIILAGMYNSNSRFDRIERRLDGIDARLDGHDLRFDDLKDASHKDALEIMRQMTVLHERVAVVEATQRN